MQTIPTTVPDLVQQFQSAYWERYPDRATMAGIHDWDACLPSFHTDAIGQWLDAFSMWDNGLNALAGCNPPVAVHSATLRFHLDWERLWYEALGYPYRDPGYAQARLAWSWLWPLLVDYQPLSQRLETLETRLQAAAWYMDDALYGHAPGYTAERPPAQLLVDFALEDVERLLADVGETIELVFHREGKLQPRDAEHLAVAYGALVMHKNGWLHVRGTASTFSELRWGTDRLQQAVSLLSGSSGGLHERSMRLSHLLYLVDEELQLIQTELRQLAQQIDRKRSPSAVIHDLDSGALSPDNIPETVRRTAAAVLQTLSQAGFDVNVQHPLRVLPAPQFLNPHHPVTVLLPGVFDSRETPITLLVAMPNPQWPRRIMRSFLAELGPQRLFLTLLRYFAVLSGRSETRSAADLVLDVPTWNTGVGLDMTAVLTEEMMGGEDYPLRIMCRFQRRTELVRLKNAIGIHIGRMKREAAIMNAQEEAELEPEAALQEAKLAIRDPIGCIAPTLGRWQLERLRVRCREVWGNNYSHQRFYRELHANGPAPIPLVEPLLVG